MKRRDFLVVAATASTSALAGCGGGGSGGGSSGAQAQGDVGAEVAITDDDAFDPIKVHVEEGEAVRWNNETDSAHTIASNTAPDNAAEWEFEQEVPANGAATFTFQSGGVYSYHQTSQTRFMMCGAVAVGDTSVEDIPTLDCE